MTPEEQVTVAAEELKKMAGGTANQSGLVAIVTDWFETMRPYVRVGLRVSPPDEIIEAMNQLLCDGMLTQDQWITMTATLRLPRPRNNPQPRKQRRRTPFRAVRPPRLGRSRRMST